jgi:hypothetical protein
MYPRKTRLNVDGMNKTSEVKSADITNHTSDIILRYPQDYDITVEKAEIPISQVPMDVIEKPYRIIIDYPKDLPPHPTLQPGENYFEVGGSYFTISEFLGKVNAIINNNIGPSITGGSFGFKKLDGRNSRILYKFGDASDRAALAIGVEIYFERGIRELLDGFPTLYEEMPFGYLGETEKFFKLNWNQYLGSETGVVLSEQPYYMLTRFYGFKSVRIYSNMPTLPYKVFDQDTNTLRNTNMLTEIVLNSDDYPDGYGTTLYIPNVYRQTEMTGTQALSSFNLWFYIHYRNGVDVRLNMAPNEYLSVTLYFTRYDGTSK